ncbi:MAG: trimethylamine methyltransferase family protein [Phycisphaerae bacterium]|nr:trimethylamine methyltransferase family protein [Phycisphaerae bacterium]
MNISVLTNEQIHKIHSASLSILERTGVLVPHVDMLRRFADAGAKVDFNAQRVRIPADVVTRCLEQAGKQFTIYGRDVSKTAAFGQGKRNFNAIAGEASWVDEPGAPRRYTTLDDVASASRLCDALEHINIAGAMSDPHELPPQGRCVAVFATMLRNTTKPMTFWLHDRAGAKWLIEMTIAVRGDEAKAKEFPMWYPFLEPISPLRFPFDGIDLLYETARLNLPVPIGPMAQMGLSAPGTLAGTMAVENAEILAGVCITQLISPEMPVCYGGICHAFDMRTTQMIFAGPEQAIFGAAMTQMGKHYGLPVYVNVGLTDAKRPDAQAGLETAATLLPAAGVGADIYGHMGICGVDQASSLDMLVMQDEVISYVNSVMRSVEISDETLGLDVIDEVGPGGTFIDRMHTAEHFRKELWFPKLLDRSFFQAWQDAGGGSMEDRCRRKKEDILANHTVEPLPADVDKTLEKIVNAARKETIIV